MTTEERLEFRAQLLARVPRWYSPAFHFAAPAAGGAAIVAVALSRVHDPRPWQVACLPLFLLASNAIEWHAHRDILHRVTWPLEGLYRMHARVHHAVFVPEDMAIRDRRELQRVLMPAWGMFAILAASSPAAIVMLLAGVPNLAALWVATVVAYVLAYEWLHLAYHLPADGRLGRLRVLGWLRRHHQSHHAPHLMRRWNFNVTIPIWDHVRGTVWRPERAGAEGIPRRA
jgi:hypothetical protein